jgi:hypothetical protein
MSKDNSNEPSIDDIVASIRRIISDEETKVRKPPQPSAAKNADILELTNMLNEDGSVTPLPVAAPKQDKVEAKSEPRLDAAPIMPFADTDDDEPIYTDTPQADAPRVINRPPPAMDKPLTATPAHSPMGQRPSDPGSAPQPTTSSPTPARAAMNMNPTNSTTSSGVTLTPVNSPAAAPSPGPAPGPAAGPASGIVSPHAAGAAAAAFDRLTQAALQQNAPPPPRPAGPPIGGKSVEDLVRDMLRPMLQQWMDANLPGMVERMVQQEIQRMTRR